MLDTVNPHHTKDNRVQNQHLTSQRGLAEPLERLLASSEYEAVNPSYDNAYQLLVWTILLTQSTESVARLVADKLFSLYATPEEMIVVPRRELELLIQPAGFYRQKAKYIQETSRILLERHEGKPPRTLIELTQLPGVARKTANVFLADAYQISEGFIVDTHVHRVANRLEISDGKSASKVEHDLVKQIPSELRIKLAHILMAHGEKVCYIHEPACGRCMLQEICPFVNK